MFILQIASVIISTIGLFTIIQQKASEQQKYTLMISICISIINYGYLFLMKAPDESTAVMAQKVIYVGASNIFYFVSGFVQSYHNIPKKKLSNFFAFLINNAVMFGALTFDKHHLFYRDYRIEKYNGMTFIFKHTGIGNMAYRAMMTAYLIYIIVISVSRMLKRRTKRNTKNTVFLLLSAIVPCVVYVIDKMIAEKVHLYLVPIGILIAEALMYLLVFRVRIYDLNNSAQQMAYDTIEDAVLVIDDNYLFRGCNNKAKQLFPVLQMLAVEDDLTSIEGQLFEIIVNHNMEDLEINQKVYRPEVKTLKNSMKDVGSVIWFFDVTAERDKTTLLKNYQKDLEREVEIQTQKLRDVQEKVIIGFANIIESRDYVTGGHIKRTSMYIDILLKGLVAENVYSDIITPSFISHMKLAAPLHDIGKIAVTDNILNKNGRFTYEEFEVMKKHTVLGAQIIDETLSGLDDLEYYRLARELALYHHEKWDGSGYPEGLANTNIPLCARLMAVVDVFDALVSKRPYKQSYPVSTVYKIIENESGKQFDPILVRCFLRVRPEIEKIVSEQNE